MLLKAIRKLALCFFDALFICASWFLALLVTEQDFSSFISNSWYILIIGLGVGILANALSGLYIKLFRFVNIGDIIALAVSILVAGLFFIVYCALTPGYPVGCGILFMLLYAVCLVGSRYAYRLYVYAQAYAKHKSEQGNAVRVIVIGAGVAGAKLIDEMHYTSKINYVPVCILDDDEMKIGKKIGGVKIFGKIEEVEKAVKEYNPTEIVIAIPSLPKSELKRIIMLCNKTGCKVKNIPGSYQLVNGQVSVASIKDVSIADLLGREQVKINTEEVMGYIENKVVLVTGGGGSIGSELCRQIAAHNPKQLIIFDIYENNAYEIEQELKRKYKENLSLLTLIGSVRDSKKLEKVFAQYKPQIVFHAAAHKHVPLMETSPNEAVKNNVSGTFKVADASGRYGVERFVLISTDKAVNPTNIMGATKRICEMIVQTMNNKYKTDFVAVRFGNVLGSNGSVIPLFAKQIAEGGPITVTHKDIVRYFMTIPEAVSLVLQAGVYAKGGEIFVLDMGEPVRIYDLAENMIKLSGLEPGKDIEIKITGLRPGEKLYEERLMEEEGLQKTSNDMISIGKPLVIDEKNLLNKVNELYIEAYNETEKMKELVQELVPTYKIDK